MSGGSGSEIKTPNLSSGSVLTNPALNYPDQTGAAGTALNNSLNLPGYTAQVSGFNPKVESSAGGQLMNATNQAGLPGAANQALATGFDPQNALYNKMYQQNQDQTNATNAANGVANTPYGAGLAQQSGANFNLDWENQAIQRQQTGAQTAEGLLGTQASNIATGAGLEQSAGQYAAGNYQNSIQDLLSYLSGGTQAQLGYNQGVTSAYSAGTQAQGVENQSTSGLFSGLGDIATLGALAFLL